MEPCVASGCLLGHVPTDFASKRLNHSELAQHPPSRKKRTETEVFYCEGNHCGVYWYLL